MIDYKKLFREGRDYPEEKIQDYIVDNFKSLFDFDLIGAYIALWNGRQVDLVGFKDNTIYIIEVKAYYVNKKAVEQIKSYVDLYNEGGFKDNRIPKDKKCIGIVCATHIGRGLNDTDITGNIIIKKLPDDLNNKVNLSMRIDKEIILKAKLKSIEEDRNLPQVVYSALEEYIKRHPLNEYNKNYMKDYKSRQSK